MWFSAIQSTPFTLSCANSVGHIKKGPWGRVSRGKVSWGLQRPADPYFPSPNTGDKMKNNSVLDLIKLSWLKKNKLSIKFQARWLLTYVYVLIFGLSLSRDCASLLFLGLLLSTDCASNLLAHCEHILCICATFWALCICKQGFGFVLIMAC